MADTTALPAPLALRDRKKIKQRKDLVSAATRLFRDDGFEHTRMEDIAAAAEVSVATVYNYFPTKQRILVAIVRANVMAGQDISAAILLSPAKDPLEALMALVKIEIGDISGEPDKKLWRELLASMTRDQENRQEIELLRSIFRDNLRKLTKTMVQQAMLNEATDVEAFIDIVYAIFAYHFRQLVCLDDMTVAKTLRSMRRDLRTLLLGHRGRPA